MLSKLAEKTLDTPRTLGEAVLRFDLLDCP